MELFKAANQWATRPADERFWTLSEMHRTCKEYKNSAQESTVSTKDLRCEAENGEVKLVGKTGIQARLTNWSFGQICYKAGAPAHYLRELPATLAVQNLNHGLRVSSETEEEQTRLMFHKNGSLVLRAATSVQYKRIWNSDILERLSENLPKGWRVPPARPAGIKDEQRRKATEEDVLRLKKGGLSINVGDDIAPAGLYASAHDFFAFMVNEDRMIDDGTGHGLGRGFFMWNSEVGSSSFGIMTFLYDAICGNHIVWGAKGVQEIRIRHVGQAEPKAFQKIKMELIQYADSSANEMEAKIKAARAYEFGTTKLAAIESAMAVIGKHKIPLNQKQITAAYDIAEERGRYGAPGSAWALSNGLTELSQDTQYADERIKLDRAAGKILEIAF